MSVTVKNDYGISEIIEHVILAERFCHHAIFLPKLTSKPSKDTHKENEISIISAEG